MSDEIESKGNAEPVATSAEKSMGGEAEETKQVKHRKGNSALVAASMGRSAIGAVKGHALGDISGSSDGTANTGVVITYEDEDIK